jgi:uracil-DNA glycosylase family 4
MEEAFSELVDRVAHCTACPAMAGRARVLSARNGPLDARVLFVAEAPGRLGADRTGVPLTGDQAGRTFGRLLTEAGWCRAGVFVTNAVLCNPRDAHGANRPPSSAEISRCSGHLRRQLELVQAPIIVTLGQTALRALDRIESHGLTLARDVGKVTPWRGRILVPLYHPGPRAMIRRSYTQQVGDYRAIAHLVGESSGSTV